MFRSGRPRHRGPAWARPSSSRSTRSCWACSATSVLHATGVRDRLSGGFRTEFFIKTGLVLLGASINLTVIVTRRRPGHHPGVAADHDRLRVHLVARWASWALTTSCARCWRRPSRSAASARPSPPPARCRPSASSSRTPPAWSSSSRCRRSSCCRGSPTCSASPDAVAGAWIGGNIDTTAAVTAAGAIAGEEPLQIATIVKTTQNALIGVVAVALTAYFAFKVERRSRRQARPAVGSSGTASPSSCSASSRRRSIGTLYLAAGAGDEAASSPPSTTCGPGS